MALPINQGLKTLILLLYKSDNVNGWKEHNKYSTNIIRNQTYKIAQVKPQLPPPKTQFSGLQT